MGVSTRIQTWIKMSSTKELSVVGLYSSKNDLRPTDPYRHKPVSVTPITPITKRPTQAVGKINELMTPRQYDIKRTRVTSSRKHRTNSWPTLRHRLWLDITDMPIHNLQQDNRLPTRSASRNVSRTITNENSVHVGVLDQWRVRESYSHHGADKQRSKQRPGTVRMRWKDINPSTSTMSDRPSPADRPDSVAFRLPSRMGPNTLESFLHYSTHKDINTRPLSHHTDTNRLLNLKTLSRNPMVHRRTDSATTEGKRFHKQPDVHYWLSDTSPPISPPSMSTVYHITNYVHTS